jgi:hypothetical protein
MYEKIEVWRQCKEQGAVQVFVCFRDLSSDLYYVQSVDYWREADREKDALFLRRNSIELFLEEDVKFREQGYPSLKEAVDAAIEEWEEPL